MTQEEKQILLKDLCARIPYGVMCKTEEGNGKLISIECSYGEDLAYVDFGNAEAEEYDLNDGDMVKPYLRPMSSMTDEEKRVLNGFAFDMGNKWFDATSKEEKWLATTENNIKSTDYLYSKYLDIHGLIEKGLALEAPENMYKTEQP